jgi:MFS family permease
VAATNTAWNLVTPFIPLYILELVGGDPIAAAAWSGIALGISPFMTAVAGPFWGAFANKYGARPAMMRTLPMSLLLVVEMEPGSDQLGLMTGPVLGWRAAGPGPARQHLGLHERGT